MPNIVNRATVKCQVEVDNYPGKATTTRKEPEWKSLTAKAGVTFVTFLWQRECNSYQRNGQSTITDQTETRTNDNAETEGFFTNRIADRGGDHPDHCCHCDPEPAARAYCRQ